MNPGNLIESPRGPLSNEAGDSFELCDLEPPHIARVAAEDLVSGISREAHRYMLASHLRHQVGRDLRGISERLIEHGRQQRDDIQSVLGSDVQFSVFGAQVLGDRFGVRGFVELFLMESDAEGPDPLCLARLHQRHDERGVEPPRQECPEWDIGDHLLFDGPLHDRFELIDGLVHRSCKRIRLTRLQGLHERPIRQRSRQLLLLQLGQTHGQDGAWRQFLHLLEDGVRGGHVAVTQVQGQ